MGMRDDRTVVPRTARMTVLSDGRVMSEIHDPGDCEGRGCWVHHPSEHPLSGAPVYWDAAARRAYRLCEHEVLHRDLDDYRFQTRGSTKWAGMPAWCCDGEDACRCCSAS